MQSNYPNPTVMHKLAKLFPILSIVLAIPTIGFIAQANTNHHPGDHSGKLADMRMGYGDKLNLTPEQKAKMEQLHQSANTQIEQILTPAQLPKFKQIESQRQARKQARQPLNLTADQQAKIKAIHDANRQKFDAILTPAQQAQMKQERGGPEGRDGGHRLNKLNLTPEQQAKFKQIKAATDSQMDAILTPEQRQKAQAMRGGRDGMKDEWKSLNLTADQQAKIKAIHEANRQQVKNILTPEQQSRFNPGKRKMQ